MGGASTAAPVDAIGANYWNPATIRGLESNELAFGMDLLYSNQSISSTLGPVSGTSESENGFFPIPTVGWVHHLEDRPISFGLFVGGVAGFKTNVNADPTNPILSPAFPLGRISSEASFMQVAPSLAISLTENLSVAAGPTITMGEIGIEPFVFTSIGANGYPSARASRYAWGGGAQFGVYYIKDCLHLGASLKTTSWMEDFRFFSQDPAGAPTTLKASVDLPMILSLGAAYSGVEDWVLSTDVRYFDYSNTAGFGSPAVFDGTGKLGGLGWSSVVAVAAGAQYRYSDCLYLRGGYTFNQSPIHNSGAFFNLATPLFYQHMLSTGASWKLSECVAVNVAYSYLLPSDVSSPIPVVPPQVPSNVTQTLDAHILNFGVSARY
jgi:long-chain fatty acid transport protein